MSDFFFNPRQAHLFNEYDTPEYTFNGSVNSFLLKKWTKEPDVADGNKFFVIPDNQYHIKFDPLGRMESIAVQKDWQMPRQWVGQKKYGIPGVEQPISYYKEFYSGYKHFSYDQNGRLTSYCDSSAFKQARENIFRKEFSYDKNGNLYCNSEGAQFFFNKIGQLTTVIRGEESDGFYEKCSYRYDDHGRVSYWEEYGYNRDEDEEGETIYHVDMGLRLRYTERYSYEKTSQETIRCLKDFTVEYSNPKEFRKTIIEFNDQGYKKFHEYYYFDGSLYERDDYRFEYDQRGNWIRAITDISFGNGQARKNEPIYEREICYSDGLVTKPPIKDEAKVRAVDQNVKKIKSLFSKLRSFLRFR